MNPRPPVSFKIHENCRDLLNSNVSAEGYPDNIGWFQNYEKTVVLDGSRHRIYCLEGLTDRQALILLPCTVNLKSYGLFQIKTINSMANYYSPLFSPLISESCDIGTVNCLLSKVIENEKPDKMVFTPLGASSESFRHISTSLANLKWVTTTISSFANWYLPVNFTFDEYSATLSAKLRNTHKRKLKKFETTPGATILIVNGESQLERYIADYLEVYENSWKEPEPHPEFIPGLMRLCASRGELRLGFAYLDSKPVAAHFWILSGGVAHIYKLSYDKQYKQLSAGTLVMWKMMKHVIDNERVSKIDFLTGDDAYKADWMSDRQDRVALIAFNTASIAGLVGVIREIWVPRLKNSVKNIQIPRFSSIR